MPRISHLSHVVIRTHDIDKMTAFYTETLGLKVSHVTERMVFMSSEPEREDHEIALARGRQGTDSPIAHVAWNVPTTEEVLEYYRRFRAQGVPIDHCVSHGNTVSCYFADPEGNINEVFSLIDVEPGQGYNGPLDLERSAGEIEARIRGLVTAAR